MAAPAEKTIKDLNGDWVMNKELSGDFDSLLKLQGIGFMVRTAIKYATITLHTKQFTDEAGVVHLDIGQSVTGGLKGTDEKRTLDGATASHEDHIFGKVTGHSSWTTKDKITDDFLKSDFLDEGELIHSVENGQGWDAEQIFGFITVNGERRQCRNSYVKTAKDRKNVRMVYDYIGPTKE